MFNSRIYYFLPLFALAPIVASIRLDENEHCDEDSLTVGCSSHNEISHMISHLKSQVHQLQANIDPNCTVCWSGPCLNGATCIPLNVTEYRCDCPPDYTGRLCEKHLECKPNTCGQNTDCFVGYHQINCVCKPGFSGDPWKGCSMHRVSACMSGDPHYSTFDGQHFDYMGTCPYVFVEPCNGTLPKPYGDFSVKAKNEKTSPKSHVSVVREVEVEMYGQKLHVDCSYTLLFNGIRTKMDFYYPSRDNAMIKVTYGKGLVVIENKEHIRVRFQCNYLCVDIPDVPELQGNDTLCGLAGNRDSNCKNDFRNKDGSVIGGVKSCYSGGQKFTETFGDTYITEDFASPSSKPQLCLTGEEVTNGSITCDLIPAKVKCQAILDAERGFGPFAKCQPLGEKVIQQAFENCAYDTCHDGSTLCSTFAQFVRFCQTQLPYTPLTWRKELGCSALSCPLNSDENPCASGCPRTCASPEYNSHCDQVCLEGCECDPTFVLDNSDPLHARCVQPEECGCMDPQGNYHPANEQWLTKDCTQVNECKNGTYHSYPKPCSDHGFCGVDQKHNHKCVCNAGYIGDGYMCTDVDECANNSTCSADKGQGTCSNVPGSYKCTCDIYYNDGDNCATFLPFRHCADLFVYHSIEKDGPYMIYPPYPFDGKPAFSGKEVYCDMEKQGGGWTLMSHSKKDLMSNKTYRQYVDGFGDANAEEVWLGLEVVHQMSIQVETSLRVDLFHCASRWKPAKSTFCTYPQFSIHDAKSVYAVEIPQPCEGDEFTYDDGWLRWDSAVGPSFTSFDSADSMCSKYYRNTGWWFDNEHLCGSANLNGDRFECDSHPPAGALNYYLKWNGNPIGGAHMFLRPALFPEYDNNHTTAGVLTTQAPHVGQTTPTVPVPFPSRKPIMPEIPVPKKPDGPGDIIIKPPYGQIHGGPQLPAWKYTEA